MNRSSHHKRAQELKRFRVLYSVTVAEWWSIDAANEAEAEENAIHDGVRDTDITVVDYHAVETREVKA